MKKLQQLWRENCGIIVFLCCMFVFRSAVADWNDVPTGSMQPTIQIGDRLLVNKMAYDLRVPFTTKSLFKRADPMRGDIVIFMSEVAGDRLVKRVIGVPGDVVAMHNNVLSINGKRLDYAVQTAVADNAMVLTEQLDAITHQVKLAPFSTGRDSFNAVTVPDNSYLVLGDNRDNSADSRVIGFVPRNEIVGRASTVLFSLDYDNYFLPRSERFFAAL
ncbi:signal peptidase I [Rheinheimera maricola]|uniref:Signal peptidase I n=1 Tax=Rheinheimera maricola TaxID=2793282 RepID=A0ABS7XCK4_9GAMM|nr:signal peptidase I [Rheinheimera maricola]MBZ9612463.1 signal peptidase I [Rheinheimera maricola]